MTSNLQFCRIQRTFKVYNSVSGKTTWVGSGLTDGEGNYRIEFRGQSPRGRYHVRVPVRYIEEGRHKHHCSRATSNSVAVGP
ncbi:MAG TPA: hypothetical protein VM784_14165 [Actinomycetota bacterium]|nr:hypothetical protein [Actinomycetota bacterium]